MNKTELVELMANITNESKKSAEAHLDAFIDVVSSELVKGGTVQLVGFGTFTTAKRAEKTGINPSTKEKMVIPASTVAKFKPGKKLKEAVAKA